MRRLLVAMLLVPVLAQAAPGAHGPNGEHLDAPAPAAAAANGLGRLPDGSVNLPMLAQRRLDVRTAFVQERDVAATVELSARVVMDPNAGGRVQSSVGGRIEPGPRGLPVLGQAVNRGEVIAYIVHHADPIAVANQQAELAELRSKRGLAEKRLERLQSLEGTVPRKEIDAARAELEGLVGRERAIRPSLNARERLLAPVTGVIASAEVVAGAVVESKDVLFEIVDPSRVLVEAVTADPRLGAEIDRATLADAPGVKLQFVGAARSLRDGLLPLTFRATAPGALPLAIGQPVTVLAARRQTVKGMVLPAQAITRSPANEAVVWIKSGAERFIPQPVRFQPLDAGSVVVTHGLGADNRVVVQGASLIAQIR